MSVSLTLGKSGIDQNSRYELEELRKWLVYNAITAGREDLYNVLNRIDWQQFQKINLSNTSFKDYGDIVERRLP